MGVAEIKDKQVSYKDMESAWKTSISMSVPKDKELIDVITSQFIIDGQSGIKDPRGMYGGRLEVSTHLVYCSKNAVNNLKKCVEKIIPGPLFCTRSISSTWNEKSSSIFNMRLTSINHGNWRSVRINWTLLHLERLRHRVQRRMVKFSCLIFGRTKMKWVQ